MFFLQKLLNWFAQLILAVEYLHSNFVLHRDLKVCDYMWSIWFLSVIGRNFDWLLHRLGSARIYSLLKIRTSVLVSYFSCYNLLSVSLLIEFFFFNFCSGDFGLAKTLKADDLASSVCVILYLLSTFGIAYITLSTISWHHNSVAPLIRTCAHAKCALFD